MESRTQGSRPRTQKKPEAKDSLSEDRHSRGQGHKRKCSPKTKKKGLHKNFSSDLHEKRFPKNFSSAPQNFNNSKNSAVLEPRTGQFSRTRGQGLQNVSSRTPPLQIRYRYFEKIKLGQYAYYSKLKNEE